MVFMWVFRSIDIINIPSYLHNLWLLKKISNHFLCLYIMGVFESNLFFQQKRISLSSNEELAFVW